MKQSARREEMGTERRVGLVLGSKIDVVSWGDAIQRLLGWGHGHQSRYVAVCNVHVVVTASRDPAYHKVIDDADMATPDGAPVAWMLRRMGFANQPRISGPDLMWALCDRAASENLSVYLFGSTDSTLQALAQRLLAAFPDLNIAGMESPPFREASAAEDQASVDRINTSGAALVFVALGCPKQETWMAEHQSRINAVMIGVGAAFDFHAGNLRRAPRWMQHYGLEWLHRLLTEPKRLWRRYLTTNTLFVLGAVRQLVTGHSA
jgi:N-acetylglucosaminyldiphosphoundecaprenol N-acetyl-beta-D-mannosaminyltransferase